MKFQELIAVLPDVVESRGSTNPEVVHIAEDSRRVQPGDLFVARSGTKASGASFAADAIKAGAVAIVAAEAISVPAGVAFAQVQNANAALALLAHQIQGNPTRSMKMLAVTGTKGKTTVAYLLRSVLKAAGKKVGMIGTVEIDDGNSVVPAEMTTPGPTELVDLFSRMQHNGVEYCVMEVSSHALHQHRVAGIDFDVAIFTNLTGDHLDYHKTMEEYADAKGMLFRTLKSRATAILNADDPYSSRMESICKAKIVKIGLADDRASALHRYGWSARIEEMSSNSMTLHVFHPKMDFSATTPLVGRHNAYNLLCTIAAASAIHLPIPEFIASAFAAHSAPGRLQRVEAESSVSVFVDYAHTHDSLDNVLRALRSTMGHGRLICLFGCGGDRDRTKRPKMANIAETLADFVIVTSDNPRTEDPLAIIDEICTGFSPDWRSAGKITVEPDRRRAIQQAIALAQPGDVVLIAGKGHENYQIIGTTKHHFDDVEEATAAIQLQNGINRR